MAAISSNGTGGGNWSSTASWTGGVVPTEGDTVIIASGDTVTIDQNIIVGDDTATDAVYINGTLDVPYNITSDYTLTLKGDLYCNTGDFTIGTESNRLDATRNFKIIINYSATPATYKYSIQSSTGLFKWYGAEKTTATALNGSVSASATQIIVDDATNWKIGDIIAVVDETDRTKIEEFKIRDTYAGGGSTTIPLALATDETTGDTMTDAKTDGWFVLNISHNIEVTTYDTNISKIHAVNKVPGDFVRLSNVMFNRMSFEINNGNIDNVLNKISLYKSQTSSSTFNIFGEVNSFGGLQYGYQTENGSYSNVFNIVKATSNGLRFNGTNYIIPIDTCRIYGSGSDAFAEVINTTKCQFHIGDCISKCNSGIGFSFYDSAQEHFINNLTTQYNTYGSELAGRMKIKNMTSSNNSSGDIITNTATGDIIIENASLTSSTPITNNYATIIRISNYNGTGGYNRTYFNGNILESDNLVYRTSASSLKCTINNTNEIGVSLSSHSRTFYVTDTKSYSLDLYAYKDIASSGATAILRVAKGTDGHGLSEITEYDIMPTVPASITIGFSDVGGNLNVDANGHGLSNGDIVSFTTTGAMPTGLSASTDYYVVSASTDDFELSLTEGGASISYTDAGSGTFTIWEKKTLDLTQGGTATSSGFIELELVVTKGTSTWNLNIDDITLTET